MAQRLFWRVIPSYLKGQSEPAMGENAWSVWVLFVALFGEM